MMATPSKPTFTVTELYDSLVKWLENCLSIGGTSEFTPSKISEGTAIATCLVQLAPEYFSPQWRGKIIADTGGNWKLKLNNLKKIQRGMLSYYNEVLHVSLEKFAFPDVTQIAEHESKPDMARLLQLLLGIAIHCEQKETYIQAIMAMQQQVQQVVMEAIQELMSYETASMVTGEEYKELEEQYKHMMEELRTYKTEKEQLLQQKYDMQNELRMSQEQLEEMSSEMELLKASLSDAKRSAGVSGEARAIQLQRQLDKTKKEKLKLETERDELKHHFSQLEGQLQEALLKSRELQLENEEIPILRDSLEEMKYLESKVKNYEAVISQYKKKLEDAQALRKSLKAMEDKNMMYMQQNLDLEEELRRVSGLRDQVDALKEKLQNQENELAQERLRGLEASQDGEEKSQILESMKSEMAQLKSERERLMMQIPGTPSGEPLVMFGSHFHSHPLSSPDSLTGDHPDLGTSFGLMEAYTPELREKMVRLEKENEILKRRLESESEAPLALDDDSRRRKLAEQAVTIERLEKEVMEKRERLTKVELAAKESKSQVTSLEEVRKTKEAEIEKYKKYLNKAKKIIESFGEGKSRAAEDSLEIQTLRNQVKEKEKTIERIEREYSQDRLSWEREEKLVVSAWFEMGLMMHRNHSQERLLSQHGSFLAQQRQALYKRPVPINTSVTLSPATSTDASYS